MGEGTISWAFGAPIRTRFQFEFGLASLKGTDYLDGATSWRTFKEEQVGASTLQPQFSPVISIFECLAGRPSVL